jgi:hypothetical protein
VALLGFLAVAGFFLWEEHTANIRGYLPLLLLLGLCLVMHFSMHGGHGTDVAPAYGLWFLLVVHSATRSGSVNFGRGTWLQVQVLDRSFGE